MMIPVIDARPLFGSEPAAQRRADAELLAAAREVGFVCVGRLPGDLPLGGAARERLLSIFGLADSARARLYRRKFMPANPNVYRGWFPAQPGNLTSKEGIDLGGDIAHGPGLTVPGDPLREATPLPSDEQLPGWREAAAAYYRAMERVAATLMHSVARGLALPADYFDDAFRRGLSTLRLIRYPPRSAAELAAVTDPSLWIETPSGRRYLAGAPHTDSGFVTLLAQDRAAGLQVRARDGQWTDVPPLEESLVVNFGQVLEQWTAGRVRATEHRVLGSDAERYSIPFFYEARADARIAPLPIDAADGFAPFEYGDFLWERITRFVEFRGMQGERRPHAR